jgi:DNA-binding NarL/FixJ family response regulator
VTPTAQTRILLADDHAMVRHGLRLILEREPDLHVVAEAADGIEAVETARHTTCDLAIVDITMPRLDGLRASRDLVLEHAGLRVLILSMHDNEQYFFEALRAGASGYVLKSAADRDLVAACRAVMRGEPFIYPAALGALVRAFVEGGAGTLEGRLSPLTPREIEVVKLIAEAHSSREIADLLSISLKTVERHRENILDKLGLRDRVELTRYAIRTGLVEP